MFVESRRMRRFEKGEAWTMEGKWF